MNVVYSFVLDKSTGNFSPDTQSDDIKIEWNEEKEGCFEILYKEKPVMRVDLEEDEHSRHSAIFQSLAGNSNVTYMANNRVHSTLYQVYTGMQGVEMMSPSR